MAKKILIIDDEELITKTLLKLLNAKGYETTVARSGSETMDKIKKEDFDLIVTDVRMPEMDGIETIQAIREYCFKQGKTSIPEIIITGYADENKYKSAVEMKVAAYIFKPFDTKEFLDTIKRTLDAKK